MALIVNGQQLVRPYPTLDWINDPKYIKNVVTVGHHGNVRPAPYTKPVGVCIHNFTGTRKIIVEKGSGSEVRSFAVARMFANPNGRGASCHAIATAGGRILVLADHQTQKTWHAGTSNDWSVGLEIQKDKDFKMYTAAIDVAVQWCEDMADLFDIPKEIPEDRKRPGMPEDGIVTSITKATPYHGFFGHRNVSGRRGPGDPGDDIFLALLKKGWVLKPW